MGEVLEGRGFRSVDACRGSRVLTCSASLNRFVFRGAWGWVAFCACSTEVFLERPEGAEWISAVQVLDGTAAPMPLLASGESRLSLSVSSRGPFTVVGYSEASLQPWLDLSSAAPAENVSIRGAVGCEPRLPPPVWAREYEEDEGFRAGDTQALPPMTSNLYDAYRCEGEDFAAEVVCEGVTMPCATEVRHLQGCEFSVRTCPFLDVTALLSLQPNREFCLDSGPERCGFGAADGSQDALQCPSTGGEACELRLHRTGIARLERHRKIQVLEVPARAPAALDSTSASSKHRLLEGHGYLHDFVVLRDRLVVAARASYGEAHVCEEAAEGPSRLLFFDRESGAFLKESIAPSCLYALEATPDGVGFLAVGVDDSAERVMSLIHADQEGRVLEQAGLSEHLSLDRPVERVRLDSVGDDRFLILVSEHGNAEVGVRGHLVPVRTPSGSGLELGETRVYATHQADRHRRFASAARHGELIAIADEANPATVLWIDPTTFAVVREWIPNVTFNIGRLPYFVHATSGRPELFVSAVGGAAV